MGQAKKKGTYEDRVKQAQLKEQIQPQHTGIDLFFKTITPADLKLICEALNNMKLTMKGHPLAWQVNAEMKDTITCKYPPQPYTMAEMIWMLEQNRKQGETIAKGYNLARGTAIEYDGSEFYTKHEGDTEQFREFLKQQMEDLKGQPA